MLRQLILAAGVAFALLTPAYAADPQTFKTEDSATAFFRLDSGATLTLELTWGLLMEKDFAYVNVFGSGGAALLNPFRVHKFTEIKLNAPVDDSKFAMPAAPAKP